MTAIDLSRDPRFTAWRDPASGVLSYVLTTRVAQVQQHFYYTNPSLSADGRWLWITVAHPPAAKMLAVIDLHAPGAPIEVFPATAGQRAGMMVEARGDSALFIVDGEVWRQAVGKPCERVVALDPEIIGKRHVFRLATHLTLTADGRELFLDAQIGNESLIIFTDIATGACRVVRALQHHHNHGQCSPTDPDLYTIAQDWTFDPITGRRYHYVNRIWLGDRAGTRFDSITPHDLPAHMTGICHEWWTAAGTIAYVDYASGVFEYDLTTKRHELIWSEPLCHAHASPDRRLWVADQSPYFWKDRPCWVGAYDRITGKKLMIASALPQPPDDRGRYHIDPHPQVSPDGAWVVYTTTVLGRTDVALCPTADLRQRLA